MIWRNDKDGIGMIEGEMAQGAYLETGACPVSSDRSMAGLEGRREGLSICSLRSPCGLTMSQERGLKEGETQSSLHNERKVEPRQ
jgi:hypothetical protein